MPRRARKRIIDESRVGTYHCSSQCVRRSSFRDRTAGGLDLSHRQEWIVQRLRVLALLFTIDILDFAVVDNQFHVVLRNRPDLAGKLSPEDVMRRWFRLSRRSFELQAVIDNKRIKKELAKRGWLAELRRRLSSISWLMIMLKEPIARAANAEDEVRGHFFAERFSSEELTDGEQRLATSLQINSLPLRTGEAKDLSNSQFTAAYARRQGKGDWLAIEPMEEGSPRTADPLSTEEAADTTDAGKPTDEAQDSVSHDAATVVIVGSLDIASEDLNSEAIKSKSALFNRLPFEVYMDWLARNIEPAKKSPTLEMAVLNLPEQLPSAWRSYGLDAKNWTEAVRVIGRRFRWFAAVAAAMRRDCRRFTADSSPPTA